MDPYKVFAPTTTRVPVLLSVPHAGTLFPPELASVFKAELAQDQDDADWYVDKLYDFSLNQGITMITAVYSRWVIDLNRDPEDKPLYDDGRIITGLCPMTNFLGEPLYTDNSVMLDDSEIERRKTRYYWPYHNKLQELIQDLKQEFGKVLLWDCHSIKQYVSTIYKDKIPDLILGDADGASASPQTIETAFTALKSSTYTVDHNYPFRGGYITRTYGRPLENQQALQLEMTKINYMDDTETKYDQERADSMRVLLRDTLSSLISLFGAKC